MQLHFSSVLLFLVGLSTLCFSNLIIPGQHVMESEKDVFDYIRAELKAAKVIPEVVDDFKPSCFVAPFYGKKQHPVAFGNIFKTSQTKEVPSVKITCPYNKETPNLTLALTDPDAPSRDNPKWSEMCHFIGIVPTSDTHGHDLSLPGKELKEVVEYKPPGPPPKTGYHRYVFLLLEGDNTNLTAPEDRQHWGTGKERHGARDWAKKEGLKVVGANFFIEKNKKQ